MIKGICITGTFCAFFILSTTPVYAYLDPGTGSMIIQTILASVLTAGAMVGVFWKAIKNFFSNIGNRRSGDASVNDLPTKKLDQ